MSERRACMNMIKQQLRTGEIYSDKIINLYKTIPRQQFVPNKMQSFAYCDMQIQLPHNQCMFTPLEEAKLLQGLNLKGHETVLEVGTGSGFLTALLSRLAKKVISVDYYTDFTTTAHKKLQALDINNVELLSGDASRGWLAKAPYDVIVFTAAMENLHDIERLQVLPGGKLFAIIGTKPVMHGIIHILDHSDNWTEKLLFETDVPPLIDQLKTEEFVF